MAGLKTKLFQNLPKTHKTKWDKKWIMLTYPTRSIPFEIITQGIEGLIVEIDGLNTTSSHAWKVSFISKLFQNLFLYFSINCLIGSTNHPNLSTNHPIGPINYPIGWANELSEVNNSCFSFHWYYDRCIQVYIHVNRRHKPCPLRNHFKNTNCVND